MKKVWDWNKFYNGLADNPYMGTDGQFQDGSVAIDVQTDPKGVKLYSAAKTLYATSGAANCFYDIGQIGASGTLSGHQDGKVYREDGTLVYTLTGAVSPNAILAITGRIDSGTPKIYVFTANKVHRFNTDFTGAQENFLSNDTGTNRHVVTIAGDIYFTSANKIYLINSAAGIETRFTGNAAETINGLTVFQDTLRAYSAYGSSYGELKIINPADGSLLSTVPFDRLPILWAINAGSKDYVVAGTSRFYSDLYVVSWTQRQLVKSTREGTGSIRTLDGKMTTRLDDVYLISSGSLENGIYKYGSYYPGFNPALTKLTDTGEINPSAIYALSNSVVFGYESPASSYVVASFEMNLPPTTNYYASEGKLRSIVFDGGNLYEAKTLSEISVAYDCDNSDGIAKGGSFSLYARKTHGWSWTLLKSSGNLSGVGCVKVPANELQAAGFWDFFQIEYELRIQPETVSGNKSRTPLIKGIRTLFDDWIRR